MCKSESIKVYEVTKETAEKLKVDEEELMYIETEYGEKSVEIRSNFSVRHDNLKPEEYRLKCHIKEKLDKLRAVKGEILIATYGGERPKGSDIENTLFYNIGTGQFGKIFTDFPKQVAFWERPENSKQCVYEYKVEEVRENAHKSKNFPESFPEDSKKKLETPIVEWNDIRINPKHGKSDKPDRYFAAIRSNFSKIQFSKQGQKSNNKSFNFGIIIELTVPSKNCTSQPASDMTKHLLDGVICAFHGEEGEETKKSVQKRFQKNGLNKDEIKKFFDKNSEQLNLFGNRNYLTKSSRWNPEDDRLQFGWIIVKCEGEEYKMSGEIYKWV